MAWQHRRPACALAGHCPEDRYSVRTFEEESYLRQPAIHRNESMPTKASRSPIPRLIWSSYRWRPKEHCQYIRGHFPLSLDDTLRKRRYAIVSLDCDLYAPMKAGLEFLLNPLMFASGNFFLHGYSSQHWNGAKLALWFCREADEYVVKMPDKSGRAGCRNRSLGTCLADKDRQTVVCPWFAN